MPDIPVLANVAIGKINQTNPWVGRGIDSVPGSNPVHARTRLRLADQRCMFRVPKRGRLWLNDGSCVRLRPTHRNTESGQSRYRELAAEAQHDSALQQCQRPAAGTGDYLALRLSTTLGDKKQPRIRFNFNLKIGTKTGGRSKTRLANGAVYII
jgi:hypothetical protein